MAEKKNLPTLSDALRDLGHYLDQYILFMCWYVLKALFIWIFSFFQLLNFHNFYRNPTR